MFVHWSIANLPWKFHANAFGSFCAKLLTGRQTDRQTDKQSNNDDYVSSFADCGGRPVQVRTCERANGSKWKCSVSDGGKARATNNQWWWRGWSQTLTSVRVDRHVEFISEIGGCRSVSRYLYYYGDPKVVGDGSGRGRHTLSIEKQTWVGNCK